ncbi:MULTISPECIES: ATP-binding protein [unclassified Moraxella]|uniref:ATP-binding protein n=1 Tax=unclassified Moraxella TaxID=2685852 RepID=UPI003AF45667
MAKRFRLDFSTAYGQLILLVFLPISVLAIVGGVLVLSDTSRAARTLQQANADNLLNHYQLLSHSMQDSLHQLNASFATPTLANSSATLAKNSANKTAPLTAVELANLQASLQANLQNSIHDEHLLGMAIVNENNQILVSYGNLFDPNQTTATHPNSPILTQLPLLKQLEQQQHSLFSSSAGTLYGKKLDDKKQGFNSTLPSPLPPSPRSPTNATMNASELSPLWLVVNLDNEPLRIARYQVLLALAITGLLTILLLLLTINVYARRWIAPIYEMRLHLQRTNANNLYKPMTIDSSGELNQLQQDLVKTLRRLHTSFQGLKNHAEQTEDDLRLAFDEMEMQNISIRNARDAAVSASQTKSAFLANISHELRTPLNSIDGFINLLARHGGLSDEQDLYVQTIRKSSAHLLALVNDVLDFSKIEAGKLVLDKHEFDLYATIYDVVDMLSPLAAEKGLRLAVFFYDDVPRMLLGDALRVKQVLTNLVNNAIKFTDDGEVVVRVSLDEDSEDLIAIAVKDTGKGIEPEHQKVLFQSFSQGDPSITRQYGGTGLGLVISKQLTFLMGGKIGFFDNNNDPALDTTTTHPKLKGTTFWFTLPMQLTDQEQQRLLTASPIWQPPTLLVNQSHLASRENPLKILVWIAHTASLQVLKGSLNTLPIAISTASTLAGLLESLKEMGNRWDWVIVDNGTAEDTTSLLKQVRLHYAGKLALFSYQVDLEPTLLSRYQALALYQPLGRRQLYQLLDSNAQNQALPNLPKWHGFRVLAVDDHLPNLLVLEALLAELGIEVVKVNSGFEAIDYITQKQPFSEWAVDLIFMDIQMPRMSGSEASRQIRQIETGQGRKHLPIIALTAHSLSDERDNLLASGIDDYVGKPISQPQLLQILQRWLGKQGLISDSERPLWQTTELENRGSENRELESREQDNRGLEQTPLDKTAENMVERRYAEPKDSLKHSTSHTDNPVMTIGYDKKPLEQPTLAVIDWQDAVNRVAGKTDLAVNLITLMIESVEQEQQDLAKAWQAQDRKELAHVAHRILGASRYTGVPQLRHASQNFEDKCLLNVDNHSPAQFAMLTPYYEALVEALTQLQQADLSQFPALKYAQLKENDMAWKMI